MAITIVGTLALVRTAVGGRVDHVTVRVDNRAGLAVQVDALDASGDRVDLGEDEAKTLTSFQEIPDIGERWTLVAAYGGTGRPWPGPRWPPATGPSRSPPAPPARSSERDSSEPATPA
jgi:catechol 2,3-dioxygenase-like lactoylglutathione lyase family enzyme